MFDSAHESKGERDDHNKKTCVETIELPHENLFENATNVRHDEWIFVLYRMLQ